MRIFTSLRRLGLMLASLVAIGLGFAGSASAATTVIPVGGSGGSGGPAPAPATVVRTVVVGGMPGWQIALIAVVAALVAGVVAVLADRARSTRRRLPRTAYPMVAE
jgi:hypothetical protein